MARSVHRVLFYVVIVTSQMIQHAFNTRTPNGYTHIYMLVFTPVFAIPAHYRMQRIRTGVVNTTHAVHDGKLTYRTGVTLIQETQA